MGKTEGQATPPGWYLDPKVAGTRRYWDGSGWTDKVAPVAEPRSSVMTIARGVALGIAVVIAALIFLGQCQSQSAEDEYLDCLTGPNPSLCVDPSPNG